MQHTYFMAWPRIMKIGQIDVLFAVTRSKKKRREPIKIVLRIQCNIILYPLKLSAFLFRPSIFRRFSNSKKSRLGSTCVECAG